MIPLILRKDEYHTPDQEEQCTYALAVNGCPKSAMQALRCILGSPAALNPHPHHDDRLDQDARFGLGIKGDPMEERPFGMEVIEVDLNIVLLRLRVRGTCRI